MESTIDLSLQYIPSENIVARDFEGELLIVPINAGLEGEENALFTFNETGRIVWDRLDGDHSVEDLIGELAAEYGTPSDEIETDVVGLMNELLKRRIVVPKNSQ